MDYDAVQTALVAAIRGHTFTLVAAPTVFPGLRLHVDAVGPVVMVCHSNQYGAEQVSGPVSMAQPGMFLLGGVPWAAAKESEFVQEEKDRANLASELENILKANRNLLDSHGVATVAQIRKQNLVWSVEPIQGPGGATKYLCVTVYVHIMDFSR